MDSYRTVNETARPAAIEEPLNAFAIHPSSQLLLPLAVRFGIAPNTISIAGIGFGVLGALAYYRFEDWRYCLLGFVMMLVWHVMDGLDGMTARATGRTSDFGRFLDGLCDYSVFFAVYVALLLAIIPDLGFAAGSSLALAAGLAHGLQAVFYEARRETYLRRCRGESVVSQRVAAGGAIERLYNGLQARMMASENALTMRCASDLLVRDRYRESMVPIMRRMNVLGSSSRTPVILASCLAGSPVYYWIYELVLLSTAALVFDRQRRLVEASL